MVSLLAMMAQTTFFHESMLVEGQQDRDEDRVEFNATDGDRGKQATDISRID